MPEELSKQLQEAYLRRMPEELKKKLVALPLDVRKAILQVTQEYHLRIEEETYRLVLGIVKAYST